MSSRSNDWPPPRVHVSSHGRMIYDGPEEFMAALVDHPPAPGITYHDAEEAK